MSRSPRRFPRIPCDPTLHFRLEGKEPVGCDDLMEWGFWFEQRMSMWVVAQTDIGGLHVSTVFLGLNHNYRRGPPILFETMVFHVDECYCERYASWEQAERGHARACNWAWERIHLVKQQLRLTYHPACVQDE